MTKILILGGTREAATLAHQLHEEGHDVLTSLAGRTKEPKPLSGKVRIGGFGGVEGLVKFLNSNGIEKMIDATHPFATTISKNAKSAATLTDIEFQSITRPPWKKQKDDVWIEVSSLEEACDAIPIRARVLLALGSQHISIFAKRKDVFFLIRMVDEPETNPPLAKHELVLGKPSTDPKAEAELLSEHAITHIVCRNSGGTGAYAKIEAARALGLPVIIVAR